MNDQGIDFLRDTDNYLTVCSMTDNTELVVTFMICVTIVVSLFIIASLIYMFRSKR